MKTFNLKFYEPIIAKSSYFKWYKDPAFSLALGCLLTLGFAPFSFWPSGLILPGLVYQSWQAVPPKKAYVNAFCFGFAFFTTAVSWIYISIHDFGQTDFWMASFLTLCFICTLASLFVLQAFVFKKFTDYFKPHMQLIYFSACWIFFEWLRGQIFTGFPWGFIGYTQINTWFGSFAPLFGVYGCSFFTVLFSVLLCASLPVLKKVHLCFLLASLAFASNLCTWSGPIAKPISVSIIQSNLLPDTKFLLSNPIATMQKIYEPPSFKADFNSLVIWPENALPLPFPENLAYLKQLDHKAKKKKLTFLLGTPVESLKTQQGLTPEPEYYNAILAIGENQTTLEALTFGRKIPKLLKTSGIYFKQHLVPFGEYLPFESILSRLIAFFDLPMSRFIPTDFKHPIFQIQHLSLKPLICYEIAFPTLARAKISESHMLVNLSEDGWFGNSLGPHQHLEIARMRALETARPLIRATPTGISAFIGPKGEILKKSSQFQADTLHFSLQGTTGNTPWVLFGLWPFWLLCLSFVVFILFRRYYGFSQNT